jgi:hypothetical protein
VPLFRFELGTEMFSFLFLFRDILLELHVYNFLFVILYGVLI